MARGYSPINPSCMPSWNFIMSSGVVYDRAKLTHYRSSVTQMPSLLILGVSPGFRPFNTVLEVHDVPHIVARYHDVAL